MKTWAISITVLAATFSPAQAADAAARAAPVPTRAATTAPGPTGAAMAATCAGCHGTQGRLESSEFAPLAGMPEAEFIRAMRDYRSGKRQSTLMGNLAKGFSEREVAAMARYFARIKQ
ncbi:MAG: hypothetical protein B7Y33_05360 [Hydrogenophilales bacterium 16-62-9]|nr:MAG: hypothetical protein B7Y33_05360 [Hydrogenophilales bacterium 16-62-9]